MTTHYGLVMATAVALTACAGEPAPPAAEPVAQAARSGVTASINYETVQLTLPTGDAESGRQAFIDLQCTACHQVAGEPDLPAPVSASAGPELGPALAPQQPGDLATAIVAPSHAMSIRTSEEVRSQVEGVLSPMGDYSSTMTVRQLLDVLAYLEVIRR